jgi:hypothetical protein
MKRLPILFGRIKVKVGKDFKIIDKAVWTEGDTIYQSHGKTLKEPAYITEVINYKVLGKTNY